MNKFRIYLLALLAAGSFALTSCGDEDDTTPTPTPAPNPAVTEYTGKLLFAPAANKTTETFFASSNGMTYTVEAARTVAGTIDFGYFFGNTAGASLASPDDYLTTAYMLSTEWPGATLNRTEFKNAVGTTFSAITRSGQLDTAWTAGTNVPTGTAGSSRQGSRVQVVANGTYLFNTAANKKGLILITEVRNGASPTDGITFRVKVQP